MRDYEFNVAIAVDNGVTVNYSAAPVYDERALIPRGITLWAEGRSGFNIGVTILNPASW